jgi:hypothetical protein
LPAILDYSANWRLIWLYSPTRQKGTIGISYGQVIVCTTANPEGGAADLTVQVNLYLEGGSRER